MAAQGSAGDAALRREAEQWLQWDQVRGGGRPDGFLCTLPFPLVPDRSRCRGSCRSRGAQGRSALLCRASEPLRAPGSLCVLFAEAPFPAIPEGLPQRREVPGVPPLACGLLGPRGALVSGVFFCPSLLLLYCTSRLFLWRCSDS